MAGAGFNPSRKDDPGRFCRRGGRSRREYVRPCVLLGTNGHKMLDSRIRRQYAPRVRGASRCCRPLPRSQPGAISSCASSQRSTAAEARSLSATLPARVRSRRCPADHWPVAQDRPRSMLLAVLLALNPFRDIPIVTLRLQGSASRTIPLAGAQQVRNIGRLLQGPVQPDSIISRVACPTGRYRLSHCRSSPSPFCWTS